MQPTIIKPTKTKKVVIKDILKEANGKVTIIKAETPRKYEKCNLLL